MAEEREDYGTEVSGKTSVIPPVIPPIPEGAKEITSFQPSITGFELPRILTEPFRKTIPDIPPGAITSTPSTLEQFEQAGIGLVEGVTKQAPATTGMVLGAKAGARGGPWGALLGGGAGFLTGYFLGENLDDLFPPPPREDLIPWRTGGKIGGENIAFSPAALFLRGDWDTYSNTLLRLGRLVGNIGRGARANPRGFLASEAVIAGAAGLGGGIMEERYPGQPGMRFLGEMGGPFVIAGTGPAVVRNAGNIYDAVKGWISKVGDEEVLKKKQGTALFKALDRVLNDSTAIQQLEELGTPQALEQASKLRSLYYKKLIRDLESAVPSAAGREGGRPTAAQKTGDLGLSILERTLASKDNVFGTAVKQQGIDAVRANQLLIDSLNNVDDQQILAMAARMQAEHYDNLLLERLRMAEEEAARRVSAIPGSNPQSRRAMGNTIKEQVNLALDEARQFERNLWDTALQSVAQRTVPSGARKGEIVERELIPRQLLRSYLDEISGMTMERATMGMPAEVRSIMTRLGITQESIAAYKKGKLTQEFRDTGVVPDEYLISGIETLKNGTTRVIPLGNKTTVQDLVNIRSDMLKYARDAAAGTANRSPSDANFFGNLAEGALDDLQTLNSSAYDKARAFSRSLNDTFTRTYANQLTGVERTGAQRIPAEILVSRAFGRDADVTAFRMDQIEGAVGFFKRSYDDAVETFGANSPQALELKPFADVSVGRVTSVTDAMERVLRAATSDPTIINPQTGRVNSQALANWMTRNEETLRPFGSLTNDLRSALDTENALRAIGDPNSAVNRDLRNQQAFAALLPGGERPADAVISILNGPNPVAGMGKLAAVVKNVDQGGGPGAINGLKSSLIDYAYTRAGGTNQGKFSIKAFHDALFEPVAPGAPSIIKLMRNENLMTRREAVDLARLTDAMKKVELAMGNRVALDQVLDNVGPVGDLAVRLLSLHGTSTIIPTGPGSLAAAGAISSAAKDVFNTLPRVSVLSALKETIRDPQLTAALLKVGRTEVAREANLRQAAEMMAAQRIFSLSTRAAVAGGPFLPGAQEEQEKRREAARMLRMMPPAPATRGVPGMSPPPGQKPPGPQSQAPAAAPGAPSQSRAMLQSLFPFDSISAMAAQQPPVG